MHIIIIEPPGSGKGTQAKHIAEKYNLKHISTGDLLRHEQEKNTEEGLRIKKLVSDGQLVPDSMINNLIKPYLNEPIILDGYPRTLSQAKSIDFNIDLVIYLFVNDEECVKRIISRKQERFDDNEATARERIKIYMKNTIPVVNYYAELNKLVKIDANQKIEKIFLQICEILDKMSIEKK